MKTFLSSIAITVAAILFITVPVSCSQSEAPKPDAEFSLSVREDRQGRILDWEVSSSDVISVPVEQQKLQELWVTAHNVCTLTAYSTDPGFEGVNVSSSDPGKVKVEKVGDSSESFRLVYAGPTDTGRPVTITATAGAHSHSFQVYSKEVINAEYMVLTFVDGNEVEEVRTHSSWGIRDLTYLKKTIVYRGKPLDPFTEGIEFTIDIYPENCSWTRFRQVGLYNDKAYSEKDGVTWTLSSISRKKFPDKYINLISGDNYGITMDDLKGAKGWYACGMQLEFTFTLITGDVNTVAPGTSYFSVEPRLTITTDHGD